MPYNHFHYYWLCVTIILCLPTHITRCSDEVEEDRSNEEEEGSYWSTFASVAGHVASSAGDTVYSAASSGANTISDMFNGDDDKSSCNEDGCVEEDERTTNIEKTSGIFNTVTNTVTNTVSSAWSSTKQATGAAMDGVRNTIAGEVDAVLGAVGSRIATALTPGNVYVTF